MKAIPVFCCFLLLLIGGALPARAGFGSSQAATVTQAKSKLPALLVSDDIDGASANDIVSNPADDDDEEGSSGPRSGLAADPCLLALSAHDYCCSVGARAALPASFSGKPRYIGLCSLRI
ncbi:hypothetical protein [Flaviaesturariibacter terrae]